MRSYLDLSSRYIKYQKKRSVLTVIGIILSVALITGVGTLITSWQSSMINNAVRNYGNFYTAYEQVTKTNVQRLIYHREVKKASVTLPEGFAPVAANPTGVDKPPYKYLNVVACSTEAFSMLPFDLKEGRLPAAPGEIVIDYYMLKSFPGNLSVNDTVTLDLGKRKAPDGTFFDETDQWDAKETFEKTEIRQYKIVGLLSPRSITNRDFAQALTYLDAGQLDDTRAYDVFVRLRSEENIHEKSIELAKDAQVNFAGETKMVFNDDLLRYLGQSNNMIMNKSVLSTLAIIVIFIMVATIAVIYNAFNMSVVEKVSQYGLLRCIGATPRQIRAIIYKEARTLMAIAIPIGVFCGTLAMVIVFEVIRMVAPAVAFAQFHVVLNPVALLLSILLGIVTVLISAWLPAIRAAKVSPMEAARNTGEFKRERFKRISRSRLFYRLFGTEGWIAWKNIGRNRKRFYITVFSMVISVVLLIAFGSMIDFATASSLYEKAYNPNFTLHRTQGVFLTDEEYKNIREMNGVSSVIRYGDRYAEVLLPEDKVNKRAYAIQNIDPVQEDGKYALSNSKLICYGDDNFSLMTEFLQSGSLDVEAMNRDNSVIVVNSGNLYNLEGNRSEILDLAYLKPGDELDLRIVSFDDNSSHEIRKLKVAAVLSQAPTGETKNPSGGIYVIASEKVYKALTEATNYPSAVMIRMDDQADTQNMRNWLNAYSERNPEINYMDFDTALKDENSQWLVLGIFIYGFVAVIALIGFVNIVNSISTNIVLRSRELSILRAVGAAEKDIKKLVRMESVFYGVIASLIGTVLGCLMSYALFSSLQGIRYFEWMFPWKQVIIAAAGCILVAVASGYIPLRRINNKVIIEGVRGEE